MKCEQLYLKLNDKTIRPKFSINKHLDVNDPCFIDLIKEYRKTMYYQQLSVEDITEIVLDCFHNKIGYLPEIDYTGLTPIFNYIESISKKINIDLQKQWVIENFLTIPIDLINRKIEYKYNQFPIRIGYIHNINHELYNVDVKERLTDVNIRITIGFEYVNLI